MKELILTFIGTLGAFISNIFGGWTASMTSLIIFIALDYLSGLAVAGFFKNSNKSESGALESKAGFKGLCRKGMVLLIVLVAVRLDLAIGTDYIRDAVCIAFIVNETISITENAGLMGVPIPDVVTKAIDILKNKEKGE